MPADWIRPGYCETGACIEYQIIGESVTIRDSATPEHPGLVFTVAEWEAFVGGLVATRIAEQTPKGLQRHAAHLGDDPIGEFYLADDADLHFAALMAELVEERATLKAAMIELDKVDEALRRCGMYDPLGPRGVAALAETAKGRLEQLQTMASERDEALQGYRDGQAAAGVLTGGLAAENTRLRQELTEAAKIAEQATRLASQRADELARLQKVIADNPAWARYLAVIDDAALRRDAEDLAAENRRLIADAAVLRHRDRRTQAVVDAAVAWRTDLARFVREECGGREPFEYQSPAGELIAAVDAYQKGPTEPLETPQSAQKPSVEDLATDGLEAQGGAQQACTCPWNNGYQIGNPLGHHLNCPALVGQHSPDDDCRRSGVPMAGHVDKPRVWNAGDPEPEGVERVIDRDGTTWHRSLVEGWWAGIVSTRFPLNFPGASWEHALCWAPLTEVLPEPVAPTAADLQAARDQTRADADTSLATGGIIPPGTWFGEPDPVEHWVPLADNDQNPDGDTPPDMPYWENTVKRLIAASSLGVADYRQPLTEFERRAGVVDPDGAVPEAGRAGEAQDRTEEPYESLCQCDGYKHWYRTGRLLVCWCGHRENGHLDNVGSCTGEVVVHPGKAHTVLNEATFAKAADRTEGLDAAIEAAAHAMFNASRQRSGILHGEQDLWLVTNPHQRATWLDRAGDALGAASPLIERAALHAAADRMEGRGYPNDSAVAWLRLWADGQTV